MISGDGYASSFSNTMIGRSVLIDRRVNPVNTVVDIPHSL